MTDFFIEVSEEAGLAFSGETDFSFQTTNDGGFETVNTVSVVHLDDGFYEFSFFARADISSSYFTGERIRGFKVVSGAISIDLPEEIIRNTISSNLTTLDIRIISSGTNILFQVRGETGYLADWTGEIIKRFSKASGDIQPATVSSIDLDVGDTAGGTSITLTGNGFNAATGATIGGIALTSFVVVNNTTITGITGAHAIGTVDIVVSSPGGNGTLTNGFEYFNPTSISSLVWWLRGDLGITGSGTDMTTWADQSGAGDSNRNVVKFSGQTVAYSSSDSSYNNKATVGDFDAGACAYRTATWGTTYSDPISLGVIGHAPTTGNRYFVYSSETNYLSLVNASNLATVYSGTSSNSLTDSTSLGTAKSFVMAEFNGASGKLFVNQLTSANQSGTLTASTIGTENTWLGAYQGAGVSFGVKKIAEVFAYNKVLSAGEKTRLRKYLNGRYATSIT